MTLTTELAAMVEKFGKNTISVHLPDTCDECWIEFERLEKVAFETAATQGLLLLKIKNQTEYGSFTDTIMQKGIKPKTAQELMSIAKMLVLMGTETNTSSLLSLNKSQLLELSRVELEILKNIPEVELEEAAKMAVKPFRERIKQLEAQIKATQRPSDKPLTDPRIEELEVKLKRTQADLAVKDEEYANAINELNLQRMAKEQKTKHGLPQQIVDIRNHALCATTLLDNVFTTTVQHIRYLVTPIRSGDLTNDHIIEAAKTIYHAWLPLLTRMSNELKFLHINYPQDIKGADNYPQFSAAEWGHIEHDRSALLELFQAELLAQMATKKNIGGK